MTDGFKFWYYKTINILEIVNIFSYVQKRWNIIVFTYYWAYYWLNGHKSGGILIGLIWIVLPIILIILEIKNNKVHNVEMQKSTIDRSTNVLHKIGGVNNIDINLSKYSNESQLIVLKNKTIHIGHNNYEIEKFIDFESIIKLEIRVNNVKVGTAHQYSENKIKELIESIFVYIHTDRYTEELVFRYSSYEFEETQIKYNEILKDLKRLQVILEDNSDLDDLNKSNNININEKSIPQQIKEYKELLDIDAITKEEFEMKKKELLNK